MGQICTSTSRIYVHHSVYRKFLDAFKDYTTKTSVIGSQFDPQVNHGPQVSRSQYDKILHYVDVAKSDGARLLLGGIKNGDQGYFIKPTIFADATNEMQALRDEIFGPFVMIQPFETDEEVIEKANDTEYGLGAAIFTQDIVRAHRVAGLIDAGSVWVSVLLRQAWWASSSAESDLVSFQINSSQDSHIGIPFGGFKQSGIGQELGEYALTAYTRVKAVHGKLMVWPRPSALGR